MISPPPSLPPSLDNGRAASPAHYVRNTGTPTSSAYIQQPTTESRES